MEACISINVHSSPERSVIFCEIPGNPGVESSLQSFFSAHWGFALRTKPKEQVPEPLIKFLKATEEKKYIKLPLPAHRCSQTVLHSGCLQTLGKTEFDSVSACHDLGFRSRLSCAFFFRQCSMYTVPISGPNNSSIVNLLLTNKSIHWCCGK